MNMNKDYFGVNDKTYYKEIAAYPILSFEEERSLYNRILSGNGQHAFEARQVLIISNLRLAYRIAAKFWNTNREIEFEDLLSQANEALVIAADKNDYSCSAPFCTYAGTCIRNHLLKYVGMNKTRFGKSIRPVVSLDNPVSDNSEDTLGDITPNADIELEDKEIIMILSENIHNEIMNVLDEKLSPNEKKVIEELFLGAKRSDAELARKYGCSRQAISKQKKSALKKLSTDETLREYYEAYCVA